MSNNHTLRLVTSPGRGRVPRAYRVTSLAERLEVSKGSLYAEIRRGKLRAFEIAGVLHILEEDAMAWLASEGALVGQTFPEAE